MLPAYPSSASLQILLARLEAASDENEPPNTSSADVQSDGEKNCEGPAEEEAAPVDLPDIDAEVEDDNIDADDEFGEEAPEEQPPASANYMCDVA